MNRAGARVVACVMARMEVHLLEARHAGASQDPWIGRAHLRVNDDATARADLEAGRLGQLGLGTHADGEDDEIG